MKNNEGIVRTLKTLAWVPTAAVSKAGHSQLVKPSALVHPNHYVFRVVFDGMSTFLVNLQTP